MKSEDVVVDLVETDVVLDGMLDEDWVCVHIDEVGWTDEGDTEDDNDNCEVKE